MKQPIRPDTPLATTPEPITVNVQTNQSSTNNNGDYNEKSSERSTTTNSSGKIIGKYNSSNKDGKFTSQSISYNDNGEIIGNFTKGEKGKTIYGKKAEKKFNRINKRNYGN